MNSFNCNSNFPVFVSLISTRFNRNATVEYPVRWKPKVGNYRPLTGKPPYGTAANHSPSAAQAKKGKAQSSSPPKPLSPSLQFYLMPSFSRSVAFGFTLLAALIAVALVLVPSFLDSSELPAVSESDPPFGAQSFTNTKTITNINSNSIDEMASLRRAAPVVFPALSRHTATVIFVHGLGDSGSGWADAVQLWQRKHRLDEVKFVLPNARVMPITVVSYRMSHGYAM